MMTHWALALVCSAGAVTSGEATVDQLRQAVDTGFISSLYEATYDSLRGRVEEDGFFQESMTGAYAGMFPRTIGALVSLFMETDDLDACERLLRCVIEATRQNDMERVPHILDRSRIDRTPVIADAQTGSTARETALYLLAAGYRGAQPFLAPGSPVASFHMFVSLPDTDDELVLNIRKELDMEPVATGRYPLSELGHGTGWRRLPLPGGTALTPGERYIAEIYLDGTAQGIWYGVADAVHPLAGTHAFDPINGGHWIDNTSHVTAHAIEETAVALRFVEEKQTYPILSARDQIDGQAHILMGWGRLAQQRGPTPFEEETYPFVARLMDRSTDLPYVLYGGAHADLELVQNVSFEHSREGRMWHTYDLLTQHFMGAALDAMIPVAQRRSDDARAERWTRRLASLKAAIGRNMTRELDGKTVYLEMRLPDSNTGVPFEGMGWVNLSPVAAQWEALGRDVLRNTVHALRERGISEWRGLKWLCTDWTPGIGPSPQVIGKGVGWEIDFARQEGEWERIREWLDFIEAVNDAPVYLEAANYRPDSDMWVLQDPGNGEQCAWWCWSIARLRKELGVSAR